jgi:hypothetical protein
MAQIHFEKGGVNLKTSCDVILDLIPLVKDNVASEDSIELVLEHLKSCEKCKLEFESYALPIRTEFDEERVVSSIKKKLFFGMSALLLIGGTSGMVLNNNTSSNLITIIIAVLSIAFVGTMIFKSNLKGDRGVSRFFMGKAIGTIVIFTILGIYLLLKYVLHVF